MRMLMALVLAWMVAGCAAAGGGKPTIPDLEKRVESLRRQQASLAKKYEAASGAGREKARVKLEKVGLELGEKSVQLEALREERDLQAMLADARRKLPKAEGREKADLEAKIADFEQRLAEAKAKAEPAAASTSADYAVSVSGAAAFTMPKKFENGVGLHARADAGRVIVSVRNEGLSRITLMWRDLAIITGPDPKRDLMLINPENATVAVIPPVDLGPGEQTSFQIPLRLAIAPRGMRLVYNNPREKIRMFTVIE